jgi:hypothetical protein
MQYDTINVVSELIFHLYILGEGGKGDSSILLVVSEAEDRVLVLSGDLFSCRQKTIDSQVACRKSWECSQL